MHEGPATMHADGHVHLEGHSKWLTQRMKALTQRMLMATDGHMRQEAEVLQHGPRSLPSS